MSERQIFSKILRLDKYIYNELLNLNGALQKGIAIYLACLLYTSPSPRDGLLSRMPSSA